MDFVFCIVDDKDRLVAVFKYESDAQDFLDRQPNNKNFNIKLEKVR